MQIQGYNSAALSGFALKFKGLQPESGAKSPELGISSEEKRATTQTFAQDIARRIDPKSIPAPKVETKDAQAPAEALADKSDKPDGSDVAGALERAVNFIRDNYGDQAATATMGLVYKGVGDKPVTEDNLGQGLLGALKFLDRNFGFEAGDKVMAFFNQDLNKTMNGYFNNGLMEQFYAAPVKGAGLGLPPPLASAVDSIATGLGKDVAAGILDILKKSVDENGLSFESLKKGVAAAKAYQPGAAQALDAGLSEAIQGAGTPPLGVSLNMVV